MPDTISRDYFANEAIVGRLSKHADYRLVQSMIYKMPLLQQPNCQRTARVRRPKPLFPAAPKAGQPLSKKRRVIKTNASRTVAELIDLDELGHWPFG